jgi:ribokinase
MKHLCVLGSINMDMVTRVDRFARPGETLRGLSFTIFPGGKGANQAVALATLGASVEMIGAVGDDVLGARYEEILRGLSIGSRGVLRVKGSSTGSATIEVNSKGENQIIVVAGANDSVSPDYVKAMRGLIEGASCLLLQLEVPIESVIAAARIAAEAGVPVILDPAPARPLPEELLPLVSIVTPNETEAAMLTGHDCSDDAGIALAGGALLAAGAERAVIKAGGRGAFLIDSSTAPRAIRIPGFPIKVVDTVAAGDSFNAGLAFALYGQETVRPGQPDMAGAIRFANAVGGLATTKEGAQSAMPTATEALALLSSHPA